MPDTWNDIAMLILRALQEMEAEEGASGIGPHIGQLTERLGMSENEVGLQLNSLAYDRYIAVASNKPTMGRPYRHFGITLLPKGRRALGEWPADQHPDSTAGERVASEVTTGSVVHITGDHNQVALGAGRDVQQNTAPEGRLHGGPLRLVWRWAQRIVEAVTVIGSVVGFVGSGAFNPF